MQSGDPQDAAAQPEQVGADESTPTGAPDAAEQPTPEAADTSDAAGNDQSERLQAERDEYLDALQRLKAEFDNYRRRMERERVNQRSAAHHEVLVEVLPVLDNLERAVEALRAKDAELAGGVEMVRTQLAEVVGGRGLEEVDAHGAQFDPTVHEAVASVPSADADHGTVIEVVQKGYRAGDEVVRAAKVVVSAGTPST
ncbi:MAG: nucleotide exchange factor GrpE [Actinobacteria bacterium]|nr:nucleotide exchange factor GrpE [Thermoleophilia bacterium]MCB9011246.1 nucleotide exchange factor GrpE [Actinomycetota bacterium]